MDQGATNSGRSPESFISHRDLTASVHDHRPRANGARDVCVSDSLSNSPLCAVAGCVSRGCLPVTGPVRPMVFHDLANQLVVAAKWSRYLTIHRRPPMPPHRNTRPLAGHLRHLQPKRQSAVPKPPGVLSEPPNQLLARQRKPPPASRSLLCAHSLPPLTQTPGLANNPELRAPPLLCLHWSIMEVSCTGRWRRLRRS
jgi:hypothetical protein